MMKLKSLILLCFAWGIFIPTHVFANKTGISEAFEEIPPSEEYLRDYDKKDAELPSLRWAAPDEDGDGFDQKIPLGELTLLNVVGLIGLCVVYSLHRKKAKDSNV